jgi:membrane protease YdiL (CAAX protease family)
MALVWMLGVGVIQIVGTMIAAGVFAPELFAAAQSGPRPELTDLSGDKVLRVMGATQVVFLVASVLAIWLYYGRDLTRRVPFQPVAGRHLAIVVALMLPLALFDTYLAEQALRLVERVGPPSEGDPVIPVMELFAKMAETGSFGSLLFILAITPAIAEEIVFRGIIGRGLLARYGLVGGVLITSILFGIVHLNVAQSVGVIPIGIAMHVAYLATRSFLVPVLMHFLNNSLPVLLMYGLGGDAETITQEPSIGLPAALAALACVITLVSLLWQSRYEYLEPDGLPIVPAYPTVEPPPSDLPHTRILLRPSSWLVVGAVLSLIAFFAAVVMTSPVSP